MTLLNLPVGLTTFYKSIFPPVCPSNIFSKHTSFSASFSIKFFTENRLTIPFLSLISIFIVNDTGVNSVGISK